MPRDGSGLGLRGGGTVDTGSRALSLDFSGGVPFSFLAPRLAASGLSLTGSVERQSAGARHHQFAGHQRIADDLRRALRRRRFGHRHQRHTRRDRDGERRRDHPLAHRIAVDRRQHFGLGHGRHRCRAAAFRPTSGCRINDGRYTDGRVVTTTMNGDLAIRGPLVSKPTLSGTVNLERTVITVPDRLPGSLASLDVTAQERAGGGKGAGAGAGASGRRRRRFRRVDARSHRQRQQPDFRHRARARRRARRQPAG